MPVCFQCGKGIYSVGICGECKAENERKAMEKYRLRSRQISELSERIEAMRLRLRIPAAHDLKDRDGVTPIMQPLPPLPETAGAKEVRDRENQFSEYWRLRRELEYLWKCHTEDPCHPGSKRE